MKNQTTHSRSKLTILDVFDYMPNEFKSIDLIRQTKTILGHNSILDGSILRILRTLSSEKKVNYVCKKRYTGKYIKL